MATIVTNGYRDRAFAVQNQPDGSVSGYRDRAFADSSAKSQKTESPSLSFSHNGKDYSYTDDDLALMRRAYKSMMSNQTFKTAADASYTNSDFDQKMRSYGLPSWSMWSDVSKYSSSGGVKENYGTLSKENWSKINELWSKDWQYGLTNEDAARKAYGFAPVSYDSMYENTLLDDELKAAHLPPSKLLNGKLGETYNAWVDEDAKYNKFMTEVTRQWAKYKDFNRNKEKYTQEAEEEFERTGKHDLMDALPIAGSYSFADAFTAVAERPEWTDYVAQHFGQESEIPDRYNDKYALKDDYGFPLKDDSGNTLYDTDAWMKDYGKALSANEKIAGDEFAVTINKAQEYYDANYQQIKAADDFLEALSQKNVNPLSASQQQMDEVYDLYAGKQSASFTVDQLFPDAQLTDEDRVKMQPYVDKVNDIMHTQGIAAAQNYLSGDFRKDMQTVVEQDIVAEFRQQYPETTKTDDEIKSDYYKGIATAYGMDDSQMQQFRDGTLSIEEYMENSVQTDEDAREFARARLERELSAKGLPTTLEELEQAQNIPHWLNIAKSAATQVGDSIYSMLSVGLLNFEDISPQRILEKVNPGLADEMVRQEDIDYARETYNATLDNYYRQAVMYTKDFRDSIKIDGETNSTFENLVNKALTAENNFGEFVTNNQQVDNVTSKASDDEKNMVLYLSEHGSSADVESYVKSLATQYSNADVQDFRNTIADAYNKMPGVLKLGMAKGALNFATLFQPIEGVYNFVTQAAHMVSGDDLYANEMMTWSSDIFGAVAGEVEKEHGPIVGKVYQAIPSFEQSVGGAVAAYFTGGASEVLTLGAMAMQSYSASTQEALLNGASSEEAFAIGLANGAAEYLFEKLSLDAYLEGLDGFNAAVESAAQSGTRISSKEALKLAGRLVSHVGVQGGIEYSEEGFTSAATTLAEGLILGYETNYEKAKRHYKEDLGLSDKEASRLAGSEIVQATKNDAIMGFVSGALMAFGGDIITVANSNVTIDRTGTKSFLNETHNLSAIDVNEALEIAKNAEIRDADGMLTKAGAQAVVSALLKKGADAATISRVQNEITTTEDTDVQDVFASAIIDTRIDNAKTLTKAVMRVAAQTRSLGSDPESARAFEQDVYASAMQYVNSLSETLQTAEAAKLESTVRMVQQGYIDSVFAKTGYAHAAGLQSMGEYMATIPEAELKDGAAPIMVKLRQSGMTNTENASAYATTIYAMTRAVNDNDFATRLSSVFGKSASDLSTSVLNACLNTADEARVAFVDRTLQAIGMYSTMDDSSLAKVLGSGMDSSAFVTSIMAIAQGRKANSNSRVLYDYVANNGSSKAVLNALAAVTYYDNMSTAAKKAADKYVIDNSDAMMTSDECQQVSDEVSAADQNVESKQRLVEAHAQHNAQTEATAESVVQRHQAASDAVRETETVIDRNGNVFRTTSADLAEVAASYAAALSDAINARDNLVKANADRLESAKADLAQAEKKQAAARRKYRTAMNRHSAAYVNMIGSQLEVMRRGDTVTSAEFDRITALAANGTAEDLNSIQAKIIASEKRQAICLGNEIGVDVEVVKFTEDFFKSIGVENGDSSEAALQINGKIYMNESAWDNRVGYGTDSIIWHELAHVTQLSAKNWSAYAQMARDYMTTKYGEQIVDSFIAEHGLKELAAEFARQELMTDPRAVKALCSKAPVMATRLYQWMNRISSRHNNSIAQMQQIVNAQRLFARALKASAKTTSNSSALDATLVERTNDAFKARNDVEEAKAAQSETVQEQPANNTRESDTRASDGFDNIENKEYNIDGETRSESPAAARVELPFELPANVQNLIDSFVKGKADHSVNGRVHPDTNKDIRVLIKNQVNKAASAAGATVDADTLDAYAEQYTLPEFETSGESWINNYKPTSSGALDLANDVGNSTEMVDYYTEFTPAEKQLHDLAWYRTDEAKEYWANNPAYKDWVHKDLAWISGAAHNQVKIPFEELMSVDKIANAQQYVDDNATPSLDDYGFVHDEGTKVISDLKGGDPERRKLMKQLVRRLFDAQNGSAEMEIRKGKLKMKKINDVPQYTGEVARDKKAYIILGRPASGKSAVFADPLSFNNKARIIDSDLVKSWLPEFAEGLGAGKLQLESTVIAETALEAALEKGENVVIPRVGGKSGTPALIQQLKKAGYEINLYYNDLPQGKSIMRAMSRFAETGRYLSINYLHNDLIEDRFKNKAFVGFETSLKNMRDDINYIEWRDNDVELNQDPVEIWNSESGEDFDKAKERVQAGSARGDGRRTSGGVQTAGELTSGGASSGESGAVQVNYYTEFDPAQAAAIDSEYMPLAEKYVAGDASIDEIARLRAMVADQAMRSAKRFNTNPYLNDEGDAPRQLYSGQKLGVDEFKPKYGPIYTTDNIGVADTYLKDSVNEDDKVDPFVVQRKDMYVLGNDDNVNLIDNARRLLNENYEDVSTHTEDEQREVMMRWKDTLMNLNEEIEADNPPSFSEIDQELFPKLSAYYADRRHEIRANIRSLIEGIEYLPLQVRNHIESIFGFGYDQASSYDSSTVEDYVRMYDSLNKKLTELFSSDPETFSSGKMKYYYDFVMNGGLDSLANDLLQQLLGDVAEYGMTNVFANQETGEIRTKGELQSRLSQRSKKGIYGVYAFEGSSPYKMNGRHSEWLDLASADYDGDTTDAIAGNAFRDARSSVEIDDIDDILDPLLMNENYSTYGNDYIFPVGTRLIKSSDLVTLDSDRNIIPLSQRFDLTSRSIDYYTQFNPINEAIGSMSASERARYGDPRIVEGKNSLMVARNVTADGFIYGTPATNGDHNIALLYNASKFSDGKNAWIRRNVGLSDADAAVIPNGIEYGQLRSVARKNDVNVVTYDENEPSQFENAVNLAAASDKVQHFTDFEKYVKQYGAQKPGMMPRIEGRVVPNQTAANNRVSRMVRTIAESPATSDEQYEGDIKRFVENGGGTYMPTTNARTLSNARADIDRLGGAQNALSKLTADVAAGSGKITDQLAIAESLYMDDEAMRSFNDDQREQLLSDLTILAHDAGTALQLTQAIKRMSPQGHESYMEQVGKRMANRYEKRTGKPTNLTLTDEERQAYRDAKSPQEFDDIDQRVMTRWDNETADLPLRERIRNWRYLSMLGNFRTHIRNIVGNLLMYPIVRTKDSINALYQLGLDPSERTTTGITKPLGAQTRAYVQGALEEAMPIMQGVSSKYIDAVSKAKPGEMSDGKLKDLFKKLFADNPTTHVSNGRTLLGRALNKISSFNSNALELEDAFSLGMRFRSSFAQQIQAKQLDVTKITPAQRSQMINYAMEEALRATFRDANTIADALNNFQRSHKVLGFITESIVPFKKTPMNIVRRSIEYSPIGLVQGAYKAISNNATYKRNVAAINAMNISDSAKQARLRSAETAYKADRIAAIDRLASGTTGGILTALGVLAASLGWITIGRKDDDSTAFETALGRNAYSLNIGDVSVDLSAFSPAAIPLLMGTALYESLQSDGNDTESVVGDVINTLVQSLDPITEMSMLSGVADALAGISYSRQEEGRNTRYLGQIALNTAKSYVGQYIPTVVGQIARVTDPYARSYSAGGEYFASQIAGPEVGSAVKTLQNKIPFVAWLSEPKVNLHGDQVRNYTNFGEWVLHTANNMLLPATIKFDQKNEIDDELVRLYGVTDGSNLFPTKPSRNLGSVTDTKTNKSTPIKLQNDAEYRQYQEEYGQLMYDTLEDLMQSSAYRRMTDDQKASAVEDIVSSTKTQIQKLWKARKAKDLK